MSTAAARLHEGLAGLERSDLRRTRRTLESPQGARVKIDGRELANFSGNDYLGLANHPRIREAAHRAIDAWGVGAGASPLVSGHSAIHAEAEQRFARFTGLPRALLFASGYAANLGILATLGGRDAEIFSDELNHACLIDGARLSRGAVTRYAHADAGDLDRLLRASRAAVRIVATDAVFSMDGDFAPVPALVEIAERHDAWLVLDDAHGIGVAGASGRGTVEHFGVRSPRILYMATLGKALGGYGAFVAGDDSAIEWLLQRARTYVYSTALPPMCAAVAIEALDLLSGDGRLPAELRSRITRFHEACRHAGVEPPPSSTAIQPLRLGDAARAVEASRRLAELGHFVPAIRPPTVPEGTSRLRVSLSAAHRDEEIDSLARALAAVLAA